MKKYSTKSSSGHRYLRIFGTALAVVVIVVAALELTDTTHIFHSSSNTSPQTTNGINYGPPTKAEKQDSEAHKKTIPSKTSDSSTQSSTQNQDQDTDTSKQPVVVHITYIEQDSNGNVEENGFVEKIVENGGTCTLTLTKAGETQSSSRQGTANATNTTCGLITINRSKLSPGTWTAVLSYSSPNYAGESATTTLEVK